jgi:phage nucleotide-binding protein
MASKLYKFTPRRSWVDEDGEEIAGPLLRVKLKRTSTDAASAGVKMLVYGQAGSGKTSLIRTLPSPIILSAEGGLLAVQDADLPYIEVKSIEDLAEAYQWLTQSHEASHFESIAIDSISEVAEVVLSHEMKNSKDGRAAYGEMNSTMQELIRAFRDLPGRHVYISAKLEKSADEMGKMLYNPGMPGKSLTQGLPYFFDEVLALRVEKDSENKTQRALMCNSDGLWLAKDRSGKLDAWEAPDLGAIIAKIGGK